MSACMQVAGSLLLDLNIETRIDLVDIEDRRFVFQVSQPSTKKYELFIYNSQIIIIKILITQVIQLCIIISII